MEESNNIIEQPKQLNFVRAIIISLSFLILGKIFFFKLSLYMDNDESLFYYASLAALFEIGGVIYSIGVLYYLSHINLKKLIINILIVITVIILSIILIDTFNMTFYVPSRWLWIPIAVLILIYYLVKQIILIYFFVKRIILIKSLPKEQKKFQIQEEMKKIVIFILIIIHSWILFKYLIRAIMLSNFF